MTDQPKSPEKLFQVIVHDETWYAVPVLAYDRRQAELHVANMTGHQLGGYDIGDGTRTITQIDEIELAIGSTEDAREVVPPEDQEEPEDDA